MDGINDLWNDLKCLKRDPGSKRPIRLNYLLEDKHFPVVLMDSWN